MPGKLPCGGNNHRKHGAIAPAARDVKTPSAERLPMDFLQKNAQFAQVQRDFGRGSRIRDWTACAARHRRQRNRDTRSNSQNIEVVGQKNACLADDRGARADDMLTRRMRVMVRMTGMRLVAVVRWVCIGNRLHGRLVAKTSSNRTHKMRPMRAMGNANGASSMCWFA